MRLSVTWSRLLVLGFSIFFFNYYYFTGRLELLLPPLCAGEDLFLDVCTQLWSLLENLELLLVWSMSSTGSPLPESDAL